MKNALAVLAFATLGGLVAGPAAAQRAPQAMDLSAGTARVHRPAPGERALSQPTTQMPAVAAREVLSTHGPGVAGRDLSLTRRHAGRDGVTHLKFQQRFAGLPVYGAYAKVAVDADGRVLQAIERLVSPRGALRRAEIGAAEALRIAVDFNFPGQRAPAAATRRGSEVRFVAGSFFYSQPTVNPVAIAGPDGSMRQGFLVETWSNDDNLLYHTVVDGSGEVVYRQLRTNTDSYNIFPEHPGVGGQQVVSNPADGTASPDGWVFSSTTTGNNVDAYLDRDNNNSPDSGGRPTSSTQDFLFTANLSQEPTTSVNQDVAVTNLFYFNNLIHDTLYGHGFTESVGNFQENNFGRGGSGSDSVNAEAQDGGGTNNANFATPGDGSNPRMQMYLWTFSNPDRDGDLDSDIVWHEYGHGLTWRMIGNMGGALSGAIGEGMSDVLAIYQNDDDVVGEYSFNDPGGIRRFPYDGYPLTYSDVTGSSVHDDGEIYAGAMWRLKELWEGSGRDMDELMDYVVDGMNFTPSNPSYEEMRDGILTATPTQAEDCIVWDAFAASGIGEGAEGTESCTFIFCNVDITESFAVPSECEGPVNNAPTVTISSPANGSTFTEGDPVSFSGSGDDTEDGDISSNLSWTSNLDGSIGSGASFSTSSLSVGTHSITAEVTDSGGLSGSDSISITIEEDTPPNTAPTVTITSPANGSTFSEGDSVSFSGSANDTEDGDISSSLSWTSDLDGSIGSGASFSTSTLSVGTHTITADVTDSGGLSDSDSISITIEAEPGNTAPTVSISSPTNGAIFTEGDSIAFSGSADDNEDGDISDDLVWTSSLDGQIGTGASFGSSSLSVGTHTIEATATDSGGLSDLDAVSITVEEAGGGDISLSTNGYKVRGRHTIDLTWSGATSANVDVHRNGAVITTTANDGAYTDSTDNRGKGDYTYQVCEAGTSTCSNESSVSF